MNSTYTAQIQAIGTALELIRGKGAPFTELALNDAASTIAALNLTKDLPKANQASELLEALELVLEKCDGVTNPPCYIDSILFNKIQSVIKKAKGE